MKVKEALKIVGSLTKTSKMPGYSYSLPAQRCSVGGKLAKVKGSVCSLCYALKGSYIMYPAVRQAQEKRYKSINDAKWVEAMVTIIKNKKENFFRWHDAGDLENINHLLKICQVARSTPRFRHWLPTREAGILYNFKKTYGEKAIPNNLVIRLSATMIGGKPPKSHTFTSTVHRPKASVHGWECLAYKNNNKCGSCRACWYKRNKNISYKVH